jgi:hypothetical protein
MSKGWVCLHRQLLEWEWYDDINTRCLFIHCLLRANHSDTKWKGYSIVRGQFITSLETLSKETKLSVSQVRTSLNKLISTGELASKSQARNRVITIVGYNQYQDNDKQVSRQMTAKSQSSTQANQFEIATDNNENNDKQVNNKNNGKKKQARFTPPTLEQVQAYCLERNNYVNPQGFIDYYESNGWMRGKNKIKDWKACVRTWEQNQKPPQSSAHNLQNKVYKSEDL